MKAKVDGRKTRWSPVREKHCDDILLYLGSYYSERGYMPSRREISRECNIVVSSVNYYLGFMEDAGWVDRMARMSRAIRIREKGLERIGVLGRKLDGHDG